MALIQEVQDILNDLAPHGWKNLFDAHGLDILASDLETELTKELNLNRDFHGFEDFAIEGSRGIEPGQPARSLVYHAFASPNVIWSDINASSKLTKFPTLKQIEKVENLVFGIHPPLLEDLIESHGIDKLAIVVFANQYRSGVDTPHKKHADLIFSRTGIARVGNAPSLYDNEKREFTPLVSHSPERIRVLPAKYNAYLAVKENGSSDLLGTKRFITSPDNQNDRTRIFWRPIQKVFNGLSFDDIEVNIQLKANHANEKIKRIHNYLEQRLNHSTEVDSIMLESEPFTIKSDLANEIDQETGVLTPTHRASLIETSKNNDGERITLNKPHLPKSFRTPDLLSDNEIQDIASDFQPGRTRNLIISNIPNLNRSKLFSSSMEMRRGRVKTPFFSNPRSAPEYLHIRTKLSNNSESNLNESQNLLVDVGEEYLTVHYNDYSGDGSIEVQISGFNWPGRIIPGYSIIAPPDFFPYCDQLEILDRMAGEDVWSTSPETLADTRMSPNFETHSIFKSIPENESQTVSALIPYTRNTNNSIQQTNFNSTIEKRVVYLPDAAAGVFAPGWDTSFDITDSGTQHLAAYGLGSPFPEDAKLCAALSSFWPAVAPDISRSFWPKNSPFPKTIIPLTDSEIGSDGSIGWDGEHGPTIKTDSGDEFITYKKFEYVDYTLNALDDKFNYHKLADIDSNEYIDRLKRLRIAASQVDPNSVLISFIKNTTDFIFRFLTDFEKVDDSLDSVKVKIISSKTVSVNANLQITLP